MNTTKRFEGDWNNLPVKKGDTITVLKGTQVFTTDPAKGPVKTAGKTMKVKVHHTLSGCCPDPTFVGSAAAAARTRNPRIVWAGTGGYWHEVDINDVPEAVAV